MKLTLPLPPPLSASYTNVRNNGRAKTPRAKTWHQEASLSVLGHDKTGWPLKPPYSVKYTLFFKDRRITDIENRSKLTSDFLKDAGIITDDSQIDELILRRGGIDPKNPRVEVEIQGDFRVENYF